MLKKIATAYNAFISRPYLVLIFLAVLLGTSVYFTRYFSFDASADTLVAEKDPELDYYLEISKSFGQEDFVFMTYEPKQAPLLSAKSLQNIDRLQTKLEAIDGVKDVSSILDVPLLQSPPIDISKMADDYRTLRDDDVDLSQAMQELTTSPLFKELLISSDGSTTALRIGLKTHKEHARLWQERERLRDIENRTPEQQRKLEQISDEYNLVRQDYLDYRKQIMTDIRQIRDNILDEATIHLSGVPMIASDMIEFVKKDLLTFGILTITLIMMALYIFFRRLRWVLLPVFTAGVAVMLTVGILGVLRQPVTVISANFVALMLIFSISFTVHLMVRYREFVHEGLGLKHREMVLLTMTDKFAPCLYTALTTMAAFASFLTSDIVPVSDFGWIMCVGMVMALFANFTFFPAVLMALPEGEHRPMTSHQPRLTAIACFVALKGYWKVIITAAFLVFVSWQGMAKLSIDSRFIEYFRPGTEIREGLNYIDENMGGTIPMDIILTFPPYQPEPASEDDFFMMGEQDAYPQRYWFTPDKIAKLHQMHDYLEGKKPIGKIISLATLEELARSFNNGNPLGSVEIAAVMGAMPDEVKNEFIDPYAVPEKGLLRISTRIHETAPPYDRDAFIDNIKAFAVNELGFKPDEVRITGMNVFFNDMLNSLFESQVSTIGFVIAATLLMFMVLLRSVLMAVAGVLPNLLAAGIVLAIMGYAGINLDMMTITIAAIIIGIGVDDAIHYLHRYKQERHNGLTVDKAITSSHRHIGLALYFTSLTVVLGFSVLAFSNFVPTIYFGILTALAMVMALLVNLTILPSILMIFRPRNEPQKKA